MCADDESTRPHANINDRAADELRPILRVVEERLDLSGEEHALVLASLTNAILAGVRLGVAETLAQASEQGYDFNLNMDVKTVDPDDLGKPD